MQAADALPGQGRRAISGRRGWVRFWAVLRFLEHGVVLCFLAGVCVCVRVRV
jgi:hypothetical protein